MVNWIIIVRKQGKKIGQANIRKKQGKCALRKVFSKKTYVFIPSAPEQNILEIRFENNGFLRYFRQSKNPST
jgi:hypothetical protein